MDNLSDLAVKHWKLLLVIVGVGYLLYFGVGEYRISTFVAKHESIKAAPAEFGGARSELGVIIDKRVVNDRWEGERHVVWWVKIPNTRREWTCVWDYGSTAFARGDSVRLLHFTDISGDQADDNSGLLIAREDYNKGKTAACTVSDTEEDMIMDALSQQSDPGPQP